MTTPIKGSYRNRVRAARLLCQMAGLSDPIPDISGLQAARNCVMLFRFGLFKPTDLNRIVANSFGPIRLQMLVKHCPEIAPYLGERWKVLRGWDWCCLLKVLPQLAQYMPAKVPLDGAEYASLLQAQPQLAEHKWVPWEELDNYAWTYLLCQQPQFAEHVPAQVQFTGMNLQDMLHTRSELVPYVKAWHHQRSIRGLRGQDE